MPTTTFSIPLLETPRLRLRAHHPADAAASLAMWQEPAFYQFLGGSAASEEDVWTKMLRHMGAWVLLGYGYWAVEEKATGAYIGAVGLADWHRAITPSLRDWPEAGWVLAPHTHGRGYATEAVQAALAWADAQLAPDRTVCLISPDNTASLKVAVKCGFQEFVRTDYKGQPVVLLERFRAA